jgi:hypothetical protein
MLDVDRALVEWIEVNVLSEEVRGAIRTRLRKRPAAPTHAPNAERGALEADARRPRSEVARFVEALAQRDGIATIGAVVGVCERRLTEVRARLEVARCASRPRRQKTAAASK